MAIWPFGRKSKRHTIQLGESESAVSSALNSPASDQPLPQLPQQKQQLDSQPERHSSIVPESMAPVTADVEPRLTRQTSKRQKNRHSQPVLHPPLSTASFHDVVATRSVSSSQPHPPRTAHSDQNHHHHHPPYSQYSRPPRLVKQKRSGLNAAGSRQNQQPVPMSRSLSKKGGNHANEPPSLTTVANSNGHTVLRKRVSQRKMNKIAREHEIRLMASSPIDIPRRRGEQFPVGPVKRGPTRTRAERHLSDTSLSNRNDSAASSFSDLGDFKDYYQQNNNKDNDDSNTNRFKVNALAAFTPRPLIRYAEPRMPASRSQNASAASTRRERLLPGTVSEENLSKRRIDHLADGLDAGALRELLERDRRRQELKNIKDQERAQRKLERSAERQRKAEENRPEEPPVTSEPEPEPEPDQEQEPEQELEQEPEQEPELDLETPSRLPGIEESPRGRDYEANDVPGELANPPLAGSWLRDASKEPSHSARESIDSGAPQAANVVNNIDDSSIRDPPKLMQRASFARSQEMGMSRTTLSPTHSQSQSPSRHGMVSPTSSLIYGVARESMSDASHTFDSERRLSDHSGRRTNTFSSLFRRGSSRLKRRYRERFQDTSDLSNASHPSHVSRESFSKIPTQSSAPTASSAIQPRPFNRSTGTMRRAHSKFTEHFGDEPLSPPDSRLQSPDILEEGPSESATRRPIPIGMGTAFPIPGSDPDLPARRNRHQRSWITDSVDGGEADNLPLSRSLASIDSEGSWMSGHFLRRISNRRKSSHPVRHSTGQFDKSPTEEVSPGNEEIPFVRFSSNNEEEPPSGEPIEEPDTRPDVPRLADEDPAETWHTEVAKKPVLVNPTVRPKSTEGLLKNMSAMSPISAEVEEIGPIEEHAAEIDYATDEEQSPIAGPSA